MYKLFFFFKSNSYDSSFDPSTIDFSKSTGLTFFSFIANFAST